MKRVSINGYTMVEMIVVLMILSVCLLVSIPLLNVSIPLRLVGEYWKLELLETQQQAIVSSSKKSMDPEEYLQNFSQELSLEHGEVIEVNERGNIESARTMVLSNPHDALTMKLWLGMGRWYLEK